MIRTSTILIGIAGMSVVAAACSQPGPVIGGPDAAVASGGSTGSGGAVGSGGAALGSGGSTEGSGGAAAGTGGASSGSGGDAAGSGGSSAGSGGSGTGSGGSSSGSGGASSGSGGATTATGGRAATGGASASGGAGGGSLGGAGGTLSVASIVGDFDGFLWGVNCSGPGAALDCDIFEENGTSCPNRTAAWPMRGAFRRVVKRVGGTTGVTYWVNFQVRGVVGAKYYSGGMRRSATYNNGEAGNDGWHAGGMPTETLYNTYEIHVDPPVAGQPNVYYLNSFPTASGYERHETYVMKYSAKFAVTGGGMITFVVHDSNCLGQKNCGPTPGTECRAPRTIDLTGLSPQPPASFTQPYMTTFGTPQWLFFDVQSITLQ